MDNGALGEPVEESTTNNAIASVEETFAPYFNIFRTLILPLFCLTPRARAEKDKNKKNRLRKYGKQGSGISFSPL
jgi:hypothetical protein